MANQIANQTKPKHLIVDVSKVFGINFIKVYRIQGNNKEIELEFDNNRYTCFVPEDIEKTNKLVVNGYSKESEIYYGVLYCLLLENGIGPVDVYYNVNGKMEKDSRVKFYKYFEEFELKINSPIKSIEDKILGYAKAEGSLVNGLISFFEDHNDKYDIEDIANNISKTLKQMLVAEGKELNLVKGKTKKLL